MDRPPARRYAPRVRPARQTLLLLAFAALALVAGVVVRSLNYAGVFVGGDVVLWEVDPYTYVRLIWLTVLHFPHVPAFDPYLCFPEGAVIPLPPGFVFALALLVRLAAGAGAGWRDAQAITSWAIPVLGGITCAVAALIAGRRFGLAAAAAAGLVLALLPAQIDVGLIGRVDHHVAEGLLLALIAGRFLAGSERTPRGAFGTGALLAAAHLFWTGSPIFGVVLGGAAIALVPSEGTAPRDTARALAWAGVLLVPLVAIFPPDPRARWSFEMLSWFHPIFSLALALFCAAAARLLAAWRRQSLGIALAAGVVLAVAVLLLAGLGSRAMRGALAYLLRSDPLSATTTESEGLSRAGVWMAFSWFGFVLPPTFALLGWRAARGRPDAAEKRLLAWATAVAAAWLLMPMRLAPHAAITLALLAGWFFGRCFHAAVHERDPASRGLGAAAAAAVAGIVLVAALPMRPTRILTGTAVYAGADEALEWIRVHTPPTRGWDDPRLRPEYAVLSDWGRGSWIVSVAQRPAVGSSFLLLP